MEWNAHANKIHRINIKNNFFILEHTNTTNKQTNKWEKNPITIELTYTNTYNKQSMGKQMLTNVDTHTQTHNK